MDDQQKSRMIVLAVAGMFGIGGLGWWMMTQNNSADKAESQANSDMAQAPAPAASATPTTPAATPATTPAATPATQADAGPAKSTAGLTSLAGAAPDTDVAPGAPTAATPAATPAVAPAATPAAVPTKIATSELPAAGPSSVSTPSAVNSEPAPRAAAGQYPATRREEAISFAKQVAGREDPMRGTFDREAYPGGHTVANKNGSRTTKDDERAEQEKNDKEHKYANKGSDLAVPPPPPRSEKPVPPPPPSSGTVALDAPSLPIDNLPQPPDKPLVSPKLKLSAIIGNKAVLSVPAALRSQNKWPAVICLGPGERFEDPANGTFSVVSVDQDSVTIEEESERSVKSLPQIK